MAGPRRVEPRRPAWPHWLAALMPLVALIPGPWSALSLLLVPAWAIRLRRRPEALQPMAARRSAIAVLTLLTFGYLFWRATRTLNLATPLAALVSLAVLAAETALHGHAVLQLGLAWFREPPVGQEADQAALRLARHLRRPAPGLPAVDLLVPCCGEPLELVERTLRGCLALEYPWVTVWVLDDAGQPDLADLCCRLGCRYRSRSDRRDAKAGNLNHVLPELEGDLLAVFDADVIPQRCFLARTVGLFDDPRVGLVQTPQSYLNADPVVRNLGLERWLMPDEEYFYRWLEPTRQAVGAVVCAGTSFVMRRRALLQVGGFETKTTSEDLATGIRINAAGYRCIYLNEKLSAGLAPLTLRSMARQRARWASGTIQTLRTGASPLTIPGLTLLQRLAYLEGILHWCNVIPQLALLLTPLSYGLLGVPPLVVRDQGWLTLALPLALAQLLLARWFSQGARSALMPEIYRWVFLAPLLQAVVGTLLGRPRCFRVTPKTAPQRGHPPAANLVLPLAGLLGLQLLNLQVLAGAGAPALPMLLSALALLSLLAALRASWDRPASGPQLWFQPRPVMVWLEQAERSWPVLLTAISEGGVELAWPVALAPAPDPHARLRLHGAALGEGGWDLTPRQLESGRARIRLGARWAGSSGTEGDRLHALLYGRGGIWPVRQAPWEPRALLALLVSLLSPPPPPQDWFRRSMLPISLQPEVVALAERECWKRPCGTA